MIEFEKVNEKGEKVTAYTHKGYLSSHYHQTIQSLRKRNGTWCKIAFGSTTMISYYALTTVQVLRNFVDKKFHFKGRFLAVAGLIGLADSLLVSAILTSSARTTRANLLRNETFPAWYNKERVVNPDRVFFELDDSKNNELNIWHSGITYSAIENLIPDFIVGEPHKPHAPVAQHHHH